MTLVFGATEIEAIGSYESNNTFVSERVTICYSCCSAESLENNAREINQLANALCIEFQQDSIAVELNNTLYLFQPTEEYRRRYSALKEKVEACEAEEWGYRKWLAVELKSSLS